MKPWRRPLVMAGAPLLAIALSSGLAFAAGVAPTTKQLATGTITGPAFYVNSIQDTNNSTIAGKAEAGDRSIALFAGQVQQSTLCSTWTNGTSSRSVLGFTFTLNDNAGSGGTDTLTVTGAPAACVGGFRFGTVDLKNAGYVTGGNATFTNSRVALSQTASSTTLTLTLGTAGGAGTLGTVATASAAVYTPDPAITSNAAVAIGLNIATTTTSVQF